MPCRGVCGVDDRRCGSLRQRLLPDTVGEFFEFVAGTVQHDMACATVAANTSRSVWPCR